MRTQEEMARAFAERVHAGAVDKAGYPYIDHPRAVAARVEGDEVKAVAWLHDVVEDTPTTLADLEAAGFSPEVISGVDAMTHRKGETYLDFVHRAAAHPIARQVKLADVVHNMNLSRLDVIDEAAVRRVERKYLPALKILLGLD